VKIEGENERKEKTSNCTSRWDMRKKWYERKKLEG
jgi:hypothetical protein